MTVLVGRIEVTTAIIVAKPLIVTLTVTYAKVNPYLSNNAFPYDSQYHTTLFVDFLKARKGNTKTIMLILIALIKWFL